MLKWVAVRIPLPFFLRSYPCQITCPECGNTGPPFYPHPFKTWALAGKDDQGRELRRCQKCQTEIGFHLPWQWWRPCEVWLHSRTPEYGKGKRRRRERRARERAARQEVESRFRRNA